ncbi:hypothetical protein MMC09_005201 [Bachmanniomyces sp. S44760]|nr:hypothetical protein [Bachmanniomyces sp. S44760]
MARSSTTKKVYGKGKESAVQRSFRLQYQPRKKQEAEMAESEVANDPFRMIWTSEYEKITPPTAMEANFPQSMKQEDEIKIIVTDYSDEPAGQKGHPLQKSVTVVNLFDPPQLEPNAVSSVARASSSTAPTDRKNSSIPLHFFELDVEITSKEAPGTSQTILTEILGHVVLNSDRTGIHPHYHCGSVHLPHEDFEEDLAPNHVKTAPFLVSKRFSTSALEVYYQRTSFHFGNPAVATWWFDRIGSSNVQNVRSIGFVLQCGDMDRMGTLCELLWLRFFTWFVPRQHLSRLTMVFHQWSAVDDVDHHAIIPNGNRPRTQEAKGNLYRLRTLRLLEEVKELDHAQLRCTIPGLGRYLNLLQSMMIKKQDGDGDQTMVDYEDGDDEITEGGRDTVVGEVIEIMDDDDDDDDDVDVIEYGVATPMGPDGGVSVHTQPTIGIGNNYVYEHSWIIEDYGG